MNFPAFSSLAAGFSGNVLKLRDDEALFTPQAHMATQNFPSHNHSEGFHVLIPTHASTK
jgi:hypothetical protein